MEIKLWSNDIKSFKQAMILLSFKYKNVVEKLFMTIYGGVTTLNSQSLPPPQQSHSHEY